jgi:Domain of unknown function (DUF4417)
VGRGCAFDCEVCPAARQCGRQPNFCWRGRCASCQDIQRDPLLQLEVRRAVVRHLGGLDLAWAQGLAHPQVPRLPVYLPILVQAYADPIDLSWVAIHGRRLLGETGERLTPKHRRPLREVYRLGARTRLPLEFYVDDRVLEGVWRSRGQLLAELAELGAHLVLTPEFSVWRDAARLLVTWNQIPSKATYPAATFAVAQCSPGRRPLDCVTPTAPAARL